MSKAELVTFVGNGQSEKTTVKQFLRAHGYDPAEKEYREWKKLFQVLAVTGVAEMAPETLDVGCKHHSNQ